MANQRWRQSRIVPSLCANGCTTLDIYYFAFSFFGNFLAKERVMWLVRFNIWAALPRARGIMRLKTIPPLTSILEIYRSAAGMSLALAAADLISLAIGSLPRLGSMVKRASACVTDLPRTRSAINRT